MRRSTRPSGRLTTAVAALLVAGVALVPMAAASASTSPSPSPISAAPTDVTFTVGISQDVDSMNPFKGIVAEAYEMWGLMYDQLIGYSQADFSPVPQLAESWEESDDKTTWTYTIRSGVSWSDGVPLTAKDVEYTFNRILNGKKEKTNYGSYVDNITKVEATNDTTVVMTVSKPSPIMESLAVPILPQHVWENVSEADALKWPNDPSVAGGGVGSGPFVFTERKKNQFLRFEANPNYWAGAPKVAGVDFRIFSNQDSLAQALKKGEIDLATGLDPGVYRSLQNVEGITATSGVYTGWDYLVFNGGGALEDGTPIGDGNPVLKDKAFRIALSHAVDTETLVERTLGGEGSPGTTVIPPIYSTFHLQPPQVRTFDLTLAAQLLDEAGYPLGPDGIRLDKQGEPITLRLIARSESQTSQQSVKFMEGWFEEIGIDIETEVVGEDPLYEIAGQATFDMYEWGWVTEPDPNYQLSTFTCANRSYKDGGTIYANLSDTLLLRRDVRPALCGAVGRDRPDQASRDRQADAADPLRQRCLRRDLLLQQPRGLQVRPVHQRAAPADTGRRARLPVRHVHVPERHPGHRCHGRAGHRHRRQQHVGLGAELGTDRGNRSRCRRDRPGDRRGRAGPAGLGVGRHGVSGDAAG